VFDALLWRKSAQLAEAFIQSDDLLIQLDNQKGSVFAMRDILSRMLSDVEKNYIYLSCMYLSA